MSLFLHVYSIWDIYLVLFSSYFWIIIRAYKGLLFVMHSIIMTHNETQIHSYAWVIVRENPHNSAPEGFARKVAIEWLNRPGRPRKTTRIIDRKLILHSKRSRFDSARQYRSEFRVLNQLQCAHSLQAPNGSKHSMLWSSCPNPLTPRLKQNRKESYRDRSQWNQEQWDQLMLRDESAGFALDFQNGRIRVIRLKGTDLWNLVLVWPNMWRTKCMSCALSTEWWRVNDIVIRSSYQLPS